MALTTKFGYTNNDNVATGKEVVPKKISMTSDYALTEDEPTSCVMSNTTCPIDQGELVSYKCQTVKSVSTAQDILYPGQVGVGVQYVIKVEDILTTTSSTDASFRVDDPIVAYLTIRHTKSGFITADHIAQVVCRLIGACRTPDGNWRFNDLMRSALKPTE